MGLMGMMARTAVVAGTATAVSGRVARRQQNKYQQKEDAKAYQEQQAAPAQEQAPPQQYQQAPPQYQQPPPQYAQPQYAQPQYQQPPPAPAAPAAGSKDLVGEIQRLADLKEQGILSDAEFTAAKSKLLGI
jgi:hypothetical protein